MEKIPIVSDITHIAFADEHNQDSNSGRFGSIALITMNKGSYKIVSDRILQVISQAGIKAEFKWIKTKYPKHKNAAIKLIDLAVELALNSLIRIDVILWDYQDDRHNVDDRDNIKNFHIMYYHLLTNTLNKFWPDESVWVLYPDETTCIDWEKVQSLANIKSINRTEETLFDLAKTLKSYHVMRLKPMFSHESPVSQLADLFAGLIPYSRHCYDKYAAIKIEKEGGTLFESSKVECTDLDRYRYEIIAQMLRHKEKQKLGISFESSRGFRSYNPSKDFPINFWWYIPQHEKDKAPVKIKEYKSIEPNINVGKVENRDLKVETNPAN